MTHRVTMRTMLSAPALAVPGANEHVSIALADTITVDRFGKIADALDSPASTTRWLIEHDLVPADTTLLAYCQGRMTAIRDAVRELLDAHVTGRSPSGSALEAVNTALTRAVPSSTLLYDPARGYRRETAAPVTRLVEHAVAYVSEDVSLLLTSAEADSLARCQAPSCGRFFVRMHARRQWCSTRCGDRVRAARAYSRRTREAQ